MGWRSLRKDGCLWEQRLEINEGNFSPKARSFDLLCFTSHSCLPGAWRTAQCGRRIYGHNYY
jgi:hypothetical protein